MLETREVCKSHHVSKIAISPNVETRDAFLKIVSASCLRAAERGLMRHGRSSYSTGLRWVGEAQQVEKREACQIHGRKRSRRREKKRDDTTEKVQKEEHPTSSRQDPCAPIEPWRDGGWEFLES